MFKINKLEDVSNEQVLIAYVNQRRSKRKNN